MAENVFGPSSARNDGTIKPSYVVPFSQLTLEKFAALELIGGAILWNFQQILRLLEELIDDVSEA